MLIYIDGMINSMLITESILKPLTTNEKIKEQESGAKTMAKIRTEVLCSAIFLNVRDIQTD